MENPILYSTGSLYQIVASIYLYLPAAIRFDWISDFLSLYLVTMIYVKKKMVKVT